MWRFRHHPRRQLVNLPMTYFKVEDERPHESEGQADLAIFVLKEISIPGGLNQNIVFDRERFAQGRKGFKDR